MCKSLTKKYNGIIDFQEKGSHDAQKEISVTLPPTLVEWKGYAVSQMLQIIFLLIPWWWRDVACSIMQFSSTMAKANITEKSVWMNQSISTTDLRNIIWNNCSARITSRLLKDISLTGTISVQNNHWPFTMSASQKTINTFCLKLYKSIQIITISASNLFLEICLNGLQTWSLPHPFQGHLASWNNSLSHSGAEYPVKTM